jgi:hypothetical protein
VPLTGPALMPTVAVSVTDCPTDAGLRFEAIVMTGVAAALLTVCAADPALVSNDASCRTELDVDDRLRDGQRRPFR